MIEKLFIHILIWIYLMYELKFMGYLILERRFSIFVVMYNIITIVFTIPNQWYVNIILFKNMSITNVTALYQTLERGLFLLSLFQISIT